MKWLKLFVPFEGTSSAEQEIPFYMVATTEDLLDSQQKLLFSLLLEFADAFALNPNDFEQSGTVSQSIDTGSSRPSTSKFTKSHSSARKKPGS